MIAKTKKQRVIWQYMLIRILMSHEYWKQEDILENNTELFRRRIEHFSNKRVFYNAAKNMNKEKMI